MDPPSSEDVMCPALRDIGTRLGLDTKVGREEIKWHRLTRSQAKFLFDGGTAVAS